MYKISDLLISKAMYRHPNVGTSNFYSFMHKFTRITSAAGPTCYNMKSIGAVVVELQPFKR